MKLKKDLLAKEKKSIFRMILGILFLFLAAMWLISKSRDYSEIVLGDWLYSIVFALLGIQHIVEGFGISTEKLFGKAYVIIDNELISIKTKINKNEETVYWKDIKSVDFKYNQLTIEKADNTNTNIDIVNLTYNTKKDIKTIISKISEDKNIKYISQ